jgi:hypothetical protein
MKASDFISESFNSDVAGKVVRKSNDLFVTQATIGNRDIKFTAASDSGPEKSDSLNNWEIDFRETSQTRGDTYGKSGSGNELQVFSFIIESIKLFISMYAPDSISFTSDKSDRSRSTLYARMANRIKIPGYHVEQKPGSSGYDLFYILRDKAKQE